MGVQIPMGKSNFEGREGGPLNYRDTLRRLQSCAKTAAKQIAMQFGLWARIGPRNNHELDVQGGPKKLAPLFVRLNFTKY